VSDKTGIEWADATTDPQKDRTSPLTIRHPERKAAGPVAHAGTGGTSQTPLPGHTETSAASTSTPLTAGDPARTQTPAGQGNPT
jgi:hypothetical protein